MDIGSSASSTASAPSSAAGIKLFKKQSQQQEAVVGTILSGAEQTLNSAQAHKGQLVNVVA